MSNEVTVSDASFEQEVLKSEKPVLVDFWAPWCGPCQMLGPVIEEIATEYDGKAKICKLNTDENEHTAAQYRISAVPTLLFFKNGQVVDQSIGLANKKTIQDKLIKLL